MIILLESIENLVHSFSRLPGIGTKTAQRLAYAIIDMPQSDVRQFSEALMDAKERIRFCDCCGHYAEGELCSICSNPMRNSNILCVVRDPRDVIALEKTREFNGKYHVLHGALSPMNGIGPDDIQIASLLKRIEPEHVQEIVLATDSDVEGEATASYIAQLLRSYPVVVSRIAHGIPIGSSLEYIDEMTLRRAFSQRREMP